MEPQAVTMATLLERHDGILLDAYGVLVDARGALPDTAALLAHLERTNKPYAIVTNDASRSQHTYRARFAGYGIDVPAHRFVTSGSLLPDYFRAKNLAGARTAVLGTPDSIAFVEQGGGVSVPLERGVEIDAICVCDDDGFDFLPAIEIALSAIVRAVEAGRRPALILPNPDLVYPKGAGEYGFTAGAIALLLEAALARRFPAKDLAFARLGKPEPHLLTAAAAMLDVPVSRLVMVGDQLETDIAAARAAGVAPALLAGVSRWEHSSKRSNGPTPSYLLDRIHP